MVETVERQPYQKAAEKTDSPLLMHLRAEEYSTGARPHHADTVIKTMEVESIQNGIDMAARILTNLKFDTQYVKLEFGTADNLRKFGR